MDSEGRIWIDCECGEQFYPAPRQEKCLACGKKFRTLMDALFNGEKIERRDPTWLPVRTPRYARRRASKMKTDG